MPLYDVWFNFTEGGVCTIEAKTKKEAKKLLEDHIDMYSLDGLDEKNWGYDCTMRDWDIFEVNAVHIK